MRKGLFYEEVQHAIDHHAGLYDAYWFGNMSYLQVHSITAKQIIENKWFDLTVDDISSLGSFIAKHSK